MSSMKMRAGLPRIPGGEAWPGGEVNSSVKAVPAEAKMESSQIDSNDVSGVIKLHLSSPRQTPEPSPVPNKVVTAAGMVTRPNLKLRTGLPRVPGGPDWPDGIQIEGAAHTALEEIEPEQTHSLDEEIVVSATPVASEPTPAKLVENSTQGDSDPLPLKAIWPRLTPVARRGLIAIGLVIAFAIVVEIVRILVKIPAIESFMLSFPGASAVTEAREPGLPDWLRWQHFLNFFFMVLVIRTGIRIRTETRPSAFWTSRRNTSHKVSLSIWFHQFLDSLWLVNGVIFVALLFISGQWVRVVPTSWDVIPNAVSAGLQYLSFNWPTENGWVNYNSLQVLAYFTTIFVAAPLAAATGLRMSGFWPSHAKWLSRVYPMELARAIHFPVMIYFTAFIVVHVFLVFSTGVLRNLNHMYAGTDTTSWLGFGIFIITVALTVGAVFLIRPLIIAPLAKFFGTVSSR